MVIVAIALGIVFAATNYENFQAAPRNEAVISGVGNSTTHSTTASNCNPQNTAGISVKASIGAGAAGNTITGTAKCSINLAATASTTSTDPGGPSHVTTATGAAGQGRSTCIANYVETAPGAATSGWTVICNFG